MQNHFLQTVLALRGSGGLSLEAEWSDSGLGAWSAHLPNFHCKLSASPWNHPSGEIDHCAFRDSLEFVVMEASGDRRVIGKGVLHTKYQG